MDSFAKSESSDTEDYVSSDEENYMKRFRKDGIFTLLPSSAQRLPAAMRIPEIRDAVSRNRVVCILGNTGCGKSTIVPFVMGNGEGVKVLCTQPRRMAAISLSEHVQKSFYGQRNHPAVGYRVRGQRTDSEESKIIYVTAGYLKTMLTHDPNELASFTHIILDEVHERGIDSDFLSLIVKRLLLLPENQHIKLIVMSATLESELFVDYFSILNQGSAPATVKLTVHRSDKSNHRIDEYFLDDLYEYRGAESANRFFESQVIPRAEQSHGVVCGELSDPIQNLAVDIALQNSRDRYSSLIFLPGLGEIYSLNDKLVDALYRSGETLVSTEALLDPSSSPLPTQSSYYHIFILHSSMPYEEQKLALREPAHNARHIVLCTNVAESSLTVPNVDVVIDTGLRKANSYDPRTGIFRLTSVWCSRASCLQRRGRTGRVCDGKYFKLFSNEFYHTRMLPYDTPEVVLTDLSSVFLNAKYISEFWRQPDGGNRVVRPSDILRELITPPRVKSVKAAVQDLFEAGILRHEPDEMSELSLLGTLATRLHVEPQVARILYFGWLSGLVCEGLILAAACGMDTDVIRGSSARTHPGKDDYCRNIFDFMWYRTGYDLGSFSEPVACRNLLWAWLCSHYGIKNSEAPEYFNKAIYAKEFDSFKRSLLNHCAQFISWMEEEVCDQHARDEAELLRDLLSERWRKSADIQEALSGRVFKCGRDFEKLKALLVLSMNTRLLTADAGTSSLDENHSIKLEKLPETVFVDCETEDDRFDRVSELAVRLTGRSPREVLQIDRGSSVGINTSWVLWPSKDYATPDEIAFAPASDFHNVKDDYHLLPNKQCEFFGMVMPIAVRTCMQIFDRRYHCNLEFVPKTSQRVVKAKIKTPQYSNGLKWGRISKKSDEFDLSTWLPVSVNTRSPVGWLHRGAVDRFWGVAGKIVGTTKSMFEDVLPAEARAINVTILPVARGGRVAAGFLLMALPFHSGLVAEVVISPQGVYEVLRVRFEGRYFDVNRSQEFPLTMKMLKAISDVRQLVAKAIDIPGSSIKQTDGSAASCLSLAPEAMQRVRGIQLGTNDELSLSEAIDCMLDGLYSQRETSHNSNDVVRRKVMLIPDSGSSYTEIITDPTLWVPPSIGEQSMLAKRMLFRKDQVADIQQRVLQPNYVAPKLVNHRDKQEAPIVRLSALGFSVDEIHQFMDRRPRFAMAGLPLDTIMDSEIDEESLVAAIGAWMEASDIIDTTPSPQHVDDDPLDYDAMCEEPIPVPKRLPPTLPVSLDAEPLFEETSPIPYNSPPSVRTYVDVRPYVAPIARERSLVPDMQTDDPMARVWREIEEESRVPTGDSSLSPSERLGNLWQRINQIARTYDRS